jgi:AcrR family transcriptional regulator
LVEAAASFFATRGYTATSVPQITAAAGISVGGFYLHFASKADIAAHLAERDHVRLLAAIDSLDLGDPRSLERSMGELFSREGLGLQAAVAEAGALSPRVRSLARDLRETTRERVAQAVRRAREGRKATDEPVVHPDVVAWAFLGLFSLAAIDGLGELEARANDIARMVSLLATAT